MTPKKFHLPILLCCLLPIIVSCASAPIEKSKIHESPVSALKRNGVEAYDDRGRFREILCTLNDSHGRQSSSFQACDLILHRFPDESPGTGAMVRLSNTKPLLRIGVVGGLGTDCVAEIIQPYSFALDHLQSQGYRISVIQVDGLSSSRTNGKEIRDAVMQMDLTPGEKLILIGYSKGIPDILEGIARHPQIATRLAAVVSIAGAVGGSPLALSASESTLELIEYLPGADCDDGDRGALNSLDPRVRKKFLNENELPSSIQYFSISTFAERSSISTALRSGYDDLASIDPRNDGQTLFFDQIIPKSHILGFVNADHWAIALPITRQWPHLASILVEKNDFPREVFLEAVVRYVEERLFAELNS